MTRSVSFLFSIVDCEKTGGIAVFRKTTPWDGNPSDSNYWLASFNYMRSALEFTSAAALEAKKFHPNAIVLIAGIGTEIKEQS